LSDQKEGRTVQVMRLPGPAVLGAIYGASEVLLAFTHRSRAGTVSRDRRSLLLLWCVILVCLWAGVSSLSVFPGARLPQPRLCYLIGFFIFVAGILLRWYSIFYLGRYFTVDVAIAEGHQVIDSGPYRHIRHPSYTGALIVFVGFGLCLGNWAALLFLAPIIGAFLWRMKVEEQALLNALGGTYRAYMQRTKRLIPFVY
jgi:protein-S-isoprenylcysteine O-methyltransferase